MAEKDVVDILKELVDELNELADEKNRVIHDATHGVHQVIYYNALAAGIYEACYKVIEKKDAIIKARNDQIKTKEWIERMDAIEQEIIYNRLNGCS